MKKQAKVNNSKLTLKCQPMEEKDARDKASYEGLAYDVMLHSSIGRVTGWLSPASLGLAIFDWWSHLLISPAKQFDLVQKAWDSFYQFNLETATYSGLLPCNLKLYCKPRSEDTRFKNELWGDAPFNLYSQSFLFCEKWWDDATKNIRGVSKHHEDVVNMTMRQILDLFSPSNNPFTNPEVISATIHSGGANFVAGWSNFIEDAYRIKNKLLPAGTEKFCVGDKVAITRGKVVYRNHLIELIQYTATTPEVEAEPILIVPAWIMKYYILDLSPHNSLVKFLVSKGHTVFMISWRNPTSEDRNLGLDDYLNLGIMNSIDMIQKIIPDKKIHATGYCLGGTLLAMAAAAMDLTNDERLKSMTLFAAQTDFKEPGELSLFIDPSQIAYLEDIMWEKGYLDGSQMSWAFSMLRSNDLIWSRMIHDYLLGKRRPINDLIAWDYDTTRLPYKMHSEYLHHLFLHNELVQGHYTVNRKKIALSDIKVPVFVVSTLKDHVSPWRSVYKIQLYMNTDVTFVLASGGHNAGIVSEPGHKNRSYQVAARRKGDRYINPDLWLEKAEKHDGSWWPEWNSWLNQLSSGKTPPPAMGDPKRDFQLYDAPGHYVFEK